ncbi:MAG: polymer-forming cytoskeletal protein [Saprospiraceae bacterium]
MFGKEKTSPGNKSNPSPAGSVGFNNLLQDTQLEGKVHASADFRIDGKFQGTLHCKARVIIGTTGLVEGDVYCQNAIIEGKLIGNLIVDDLLQIKETAHIKGEIKTGKLLVQPGAMVDGTCKMTGEKTAPTAAVNADKKLQNVN